MLLGISGRSPRHIHFPMPPSTRFVCIPETGDDRSSSMEQSFTSSKDVVQAYCRTSGNGSLVRSRFSPSCVMEHHGSKKLLGAQGIAARNKEATRNPGITTSSKCIATSHGIYPFERRRLAHRPAELVDETSLVASLARQLQKKAFHTLGRRFAEHAELLTPTQVSWALKRTKMGTPKASKSL